MLDTGTRCRDHTVAPLPRLENSFGRMAASLNVYAPAGLLQLGFAFNVAVATVGVDTPAGVAQVEQLLDDTGIDHGNMHNGDLADQLATLVDAGMQP